MGSYPFDPEQCMWQNRGSLRHCARPAVVIYRNGGNFLTQFCADHDQPGEWGSLTEPLTFHYLSKVAAHRF